jgi:hypothetical protein
MNIYDRPDELVTAEGALAGEVLDFPDIQRGWGIAFDQTGGLPPMEWMNGLFRRIDRATRYFLQRGLPEWSETETYPQGAYVQYAFQTYYSKRENTNKQPGAVGSSNDWGRWSVTRDEFTAATAGHRLLRVQSLASSGTFTPLSPDNYAWIRAWGGGGGGGGGTSSLSGAGGGGGGYVEWFGPFSAFGLGPTYAYSVGAAGAAGVGVSGGSGGNGGNTTFATNQLIASGGVGGAGGTVGGSSGAGGSVSVTPPGLIIGLQGREGQGTFNPQIPGSGGNAFSGAGGVPHTTTGGSGIGGGGGSGGGPAGVMTGGAGGPGLFIMAEYSP